MERSLFVSVPWVDLQMAAIAVVALVGLVGVTVRLALDSTLPGGQRLAAGQAGPPRPAEPLTPEWLERLISGAAVPRSPRPQPDDRDAEDREVA